MAEQEKFTRKDWCADLRRKLFGSVTLQDLWEYLTVIRADVYDPAIIERDVIVLTSRKQFLRAVLYFHRPGPYMEMQGRFMDPICIKISRVRMRFRRYDLYIVPTDENYLIYKERC